jgi:lauroyl/myristoyl acyltransferase
MNELLERAETTRAAEIQTIPDGLISRLYGCPAIHRLIPTPLALGLAGIRGALEWWLVRSRRERALGIASTTLGRPGDSPEARRLGRRYLEEKAMQGEFSWRPWAARKMEIEGSEHLREAESGGKGVLLAGMHFGPLLSFHLAAAEMGFKLYISGGHRPEEGAIPGYTGRWTKAQNLWQEASGNRWVHLGNSYPVLREVLLHGGICWLAWDTLGGAVSTTTYLGRTIRVQPGIARLHLETGAPILPTITLRDRAKMRSVVCPPVDLPEGAGEKEINDAIGRVMTDLVSPHLAQLHYQSAELFRQGRSGPQ